MHDNGSVMVWLLLLCCAQPLREGCEEGEIYDRGICEKYKAGDPVDSTGVWKPPPETTWQWQLTKPIDTSLDVEMYDVDLFGARDDAFDALEGKIRICYFSAGSWEEWRDDVDAVSNDALGATLENWDDERWFDVMHPTVRTLMTDRLDYAVERGCDGVEPDNVDGYANVSGFPLTAAEQLDFNRFLADEAHNRGLSVGLKNDLDQLEALEPWFDWALNEECAAYDECGRMKVFTDAGKAVFHTEYVDDWADAEELAAEVCGIGKLSTLVKTWDLGPEFLDCP